MVVPHFLGPKVLITFFHCRPLFLAWSIFVMDVHVVPALWWMRTGRDLVYKYNWSDEYIKTVTDWAKQHSIAGAIKRHQKGD